MPRIGGPKIEGEEPVGITVGGATLGEAAPGPEDRPGEASDDGGGGAPGSVVAGAAAGVEGAIASISPRPSFSGANAYSC